MSARWLEERAEAYRALTQREMRAMVSEAPQSLYAWMRYHLGWEDRDGRSVEGRRGKMLRPVALLLAAEALGGDPEQAAPAAASVELIHNFSLLHDDVEDASEFRHGRPTVWTFAGAAQAINTGDGMYTIARLGQYRLVEAGVPPDRVLAVMRELDEACIRLVQGQYLDISFEERNDVTLDEYVEMAHGKTAAMFAGPFAAGAILAGADEAIVEAFRAYGRHLGLAFQAIDDILGIWGDEELTGKPVGDDLRTRKMTFPVIHALHSNGPEAARLRAAYAVRPAPHEDTASLARLVEATGAREATVTTAQREEQAALDALRSAGMPDDVIDLCAAYARSAVGRDG
jgi:geranylgeranyl diphosphate synthase, type I